MTSSEATSSQLERARTFTALHRRGAPLVLFNVWDAGSARAVASAGARAIATGSWSVAAACGYADGEQLPLDLAIANLRRIVAAVDVPVTIDLEAGYGRAPGAVAQTVAQALDAGAIGWNLEDQIIGEESLYPVAEQVARIRTARDAASRAGIPAFINARTDLFLAADPATHDEAMVDAALRRADAYGAAGGSGFFAPGLAAEKLIARLCAACPLPVNILVRANTPSVKRMAELGVARVSHGPGPYRHLMQLLEDAARQAHAWDR